MPLTRTLQTAVLLALLTLSAGCQTTIGNYFGNRARDFGECFLVQAGGGLGLGVDVKVAGIFHISSLAALHLPGLSPGWLYGNARFGPIKAWPPGLFFEGDIGFPLALLHLGRAHASFLGLDKAIGGKPKAIIRHTCFGVLPGIYSWSPAHLEGYEWIWADLPDADLREEWTPDRVRRAVLEKNWSRIHAFDVEAGVFVLLVGARVGFSPGEFLDFLLGWFGIDVAGDDVVLEGPSEGPPDEAESPGEAGE